MRYLSLLFLLVINISCETSNNSENQGNIVRDSEGKIVSGEITKYGINGKVESVYNVENYKLHGPARKYYDDGTTLRSELIYKEGKLEGLQKRFYESGSLYKEEPYVNGERHGLVKKYREGGSLMTEVSYKHGQPGTILKEYLTDGSLKTKYPKIVVDEVNTLSINGEYTIRVSMSDKSSNVKYFLGELDEGIYFSKSLKQQHNVTDGVLELKAFLKRGESLRQDINIVARMPTRLNNTYLTSHRISLNVSN
jgi:hypothetical protein